MPQEITTFAHISEFSWRDICPAASKFTVSPSRWRWLTWLKTRTCAVWQWCQPMKRVREEKITRTVLDKNKLMDMLHKHQANVLQLMMGQRCNKIVMGYKQYYELTDQFVQSSFSFPLNVNFHDGRTCQILGLEVIIVPWIDGMFLLPEGA